MKNSLAARRTQYRLARQLLGQSNKLKSPSWQKGRILTRVSKTRSELLKEMSRVAWLLWPANGLPGNAGKIRVSHGLYMGHGFGL